MTTAPPPLRDLRSARFRASPAFRLMAHNRLPVEQRRALEGLAEDPNHYGVLVPRDQPALGIHSVDRETALLFLGHRHAGPLPERVRADGSANQAIARLVVDGILEMECDGRFFAGPNSHPLVFEESCAPPKPDHPLAALSHEALRSAQNLPIDDPARMSAWLYSYNTMPMNPRWVRRYCGSREIDEALGLEGSGSAGRLLEDRYLRSRQPAWTSWSLRTGELADGGFSDTKPTYKLYVSLHPTSLPEAFRIVPGHLVEAAVPAFKLGNNVQGLLRPDKFMLYFHDIDSLLETAAVLEEALTGCRAQGVPFTSALGDSGILSWGIDPPRSERLPSWPGGESWRAWVINRLARALLRARALGGAGTQPWLCALDRLRLEGINVDGWLPAESIWRTGEAS